MHIPSARIQKEMRSEAASIWYVPANAGEEVAVLIKAPTSSIKALIAGCGLDLCFGRSESHLCTGVRIHDMPDAPVFVCGLQRDLEEHVALMEVLTRKTFPVFLFNELDICLAWTNCELSESMAADVIGFIGNTNNLYVGPFGDAENRVLDCFCVSTDPSRNIDGAVVIPTIERSPSLEAWRITNVSFVGLGTHQTISIGDRENEGEMLERAIWASLESVFPLTLVKSPEVQIGDKRRELTDVFSHYEHGSFLIEAKDLSVLQAGFERDQERRTKGVQKQVKKAITQLVGAAKALSRGDRIFDHKGLEIDFDRTKPPHCIVLVTELMHWGDWKEIESLLVEAIRDTGAFFHLLDLREFIYLLKASSGRADHFDYHLIERIKIFGKTRSVHIRSRMASNNSLKVDGPEGPQP